MTMSFADMRKRSSESERHRARLRTGGKVHSDAAEDKKLIDKEFTRLEKREEKTGKKAEGGAVKPRLDHFARGGKVKGKGHGKGKTITNVIIAPQGGAHPPMPMGGSPGAPPMLPPRPPVGGGAPPPGLAAALAGGAPGGSPPMPPPGAGRPPGIKRGGRVAGFARGGRAKSPAAVSAKMHGGGEGALGRIEKAKAYGAKP